MPLHAPWLLRRILGLPSRSNRSKGAANMLPDDIQLASPIEDVVNSFPQTVTWLIESHRIRVIRCGAPIWATVEELAEMHGLPPDSFLQALRDSARSGPE